MNLEFKLNNRNAVIKRLKQEGNIYTLSVDDVIYKVDIAKIGKHEYSILHNDRSFNVEIVEKSEPKNYSIVTGDECFDVEIIDTESKYIQSRNNAVVESGDLIIRSPMPGRVVGVHVKTGDKVEAGQTVVVLSAMKMESEYKAGKAGIVTEIAVNAGDTVENNQLLIVIEELFNDE
jgi:biotin carboxyl carrier protein